MTERVTIHSEGLALSGVLHRSPGPRAIVLTGPFTGVKEQVTGLYAERLAAEGFTVLAFDHRGFGESEGRPQHEDSQGKLADLRAAVTLLADYRVALVGICLGGGYAMRAAAADPRVVAVAGIAGAYNSPRWFAERMGAATYRKSLADLIERYDEFLPAVSRDGEAAMPGEEPWSYYSAHPANWTNRVTRGSLHSLLTLDVLGVRPLLPPSLVVHGRRDDYCSPELAEAMAADQTVWLDGERHTDLYDVDPYVSAAVTSTAEFLRRF
ncbi:alpha/beta hydrolase [Paractinoplanes maris]|uniref:alpha/beta hydrolase n=1 Tax=Paractinoplanes maris TaxID=1734446 RepID=UPI002020B6F8|nr:alpha/beta hydrolase [Actinoplanes maris]